MLDKDKVNSLRDLALDHLPDTKALSKKNYIEHRNGRAALQAVAFAPTLLINSPLSTTVEKLAGELLALVGKHPDTHIEYLIDNSIDSDALSISVQDAVLWAEQDRPYIEELLMESAQKLCEISGVALPPWMASADDKSEVIQNIEKPAPVGAVSASSSVKPDKAEPAKPLQRTAAQDSAILCEIEKQGYDPLALPKNPPGKSGAKAAIRAALSKNLLFTGATVFNKAWERLTDRADIVIQG